MTVTVLERGEEVRAADARLTIINPVAKQKAEQDTSEFFPTAPRLDTLAGKTIGLFWNGKQQGQVALAQTKEQLSRLYEGIQFKDYIGVMGGVLRRANEAQFDLMAAECDAVIGTSADCGSCTSWLIHDMCHMERRGIPALAWTAAQFEEDAHWSANIWGVPDLCIGIVPECFTNNSPQRITEMVSGALDGVVRSLTKTPETNTLAFTQLSREHTEQRELHYVGSDRLAAWEAMNADFVSKKWSDGFPLVPPSESKVAAMIEASGLAPDCVVGYLEPGFGIATIEKIGANAVMAGAVPAMMPLILAVVNAALDHRSGWRGVSMSTGPQAPILMVSGPVIKELGLNYGIAPIGPGSQNAANIAIGRAIRLIMMNVGLSYPGISDMDTHGTCMKFSYCVAENEERTPWEPHRVTKGFSHASSTVTVNSPFSQTCLYDFENYDAKKLIGVFASSMSSAAMAMGSSWLTTSKGPEGQPAVWRGDPDNVLLLCPDHATAFHRAGYTYRDIQEALYDASRLKFRDAMLNKTDELFTMVHPHLQWMRDQPDTEISIFGAPSNIDIMVTGGDAGWSTWHDGGSYSVTREVRAY